MSHRLIIVDPIEPFSDALDAASRQASFTVQRIAESALDAAIDALTPDAAAATTIAVPAHAHGRAAAQLVNRLADRHPELRFAICATSDQIDWAWVSANVDHACDWIPLEASASVEFIHALLSRGVHATSRTHSTTCQPSFLADASQALRGPLDGVLRYSELLEDGATLTAAQQNTIVRTVLRFAEQLSDMIDDLDDIAQLESGAASSTPRPCSLPVVLDHVAACVRTDLAATAETLVIDLDPAVPEQIEVDSARLGSLLIGIVEAAIENIENDTIRLTVSWYDERHDEVAFTVSGLRAGEEPARELSIARRLAHLLGGRLEVTWTGDARLVLDARTATLRHPATAGPTTNAEASDDAEPAALLAG